MVNYDELPLFPLNTVLYPGMPLPLHIFEPRYLEMVGYCLEHNASFGAVLIASGTEVGAPAVPCDVGTLARITHVEHLAGNRMNIVVAGESRFRILETQQRRSYLTAVAAPVVESQSECDDLCLICSRVGDLFKAYLRAQLALNNQSLSALQLPQDPGLLSYAVANAMQIPLWEKQKLLELSDAAERLNSEIDLLLQEIGQQTKNPVVPVSPHSCRSITPFNAAESRKLVSRN